MTTKSIEVDYELPHAPDAVWRALTDSRLLASWLMENDLEAVRGHRFQFRATPVGGWNGIVDCEVLDVEPPRLLRYAWKGGTLDTIVTWTLEATPTGTRLHLLHAGYTDRDAFAYDNMDKGWRGHLAGRLAETLAA